MCVCVSGVACLGVRASYAQHAKLSTLHVPVEVYKCARWRPLARGSCSSNTDTAPAPAPALTATTTSHDRQCESCGGVISDDN